MQAYRGARLERQREVIAVVEHTPVDGAEEVRRRSRRIQMRDLHRQALEVVTELDAPRRRSVGDRRTGRQFVEIQDLGDSGQGRRELLLIREDPRFRARGSGDHYTDGYARRHEQASLDLHFCCPLFRDLIR